ncbi:rRNA maturation RNase YbeY [soil metagenome]
MSGPSLTLSVQYADPAATDLPDRHGVRRRVVAALDAISPERDSVLTIRFATRREARELNRAHRQADYVPNVLTFALHEGGPPGMPVVADIVICPSVVRSEARAQRKSIDEHMTHMIVHGVLHAHGFDHQVEAAAQLMESLERFVLRRFRIADPYHARVP